MFAIAEAQQYTWQTGQIYAETDSKIDLFVMPRQYSIYDNIGTIMTPEEKARQKNRSVVRRGRLEGNQ